VSTADVAVETSINGKVNEFLSGTSGSMVASGPVNSEIVEGVNEISFKLSRSDEVGDAHEPSFLAALEIAVKGEVIDTTAPGDRLIFQRELTETEKQSLLAGEEIVVSEAFEISRERLKEIKSAAEIGPPPEKGPSEH
jgi:hypothetical protein